jgi:hypothetical protein
MPFKTIPNTDVKYALIAFNADGVERTDDPDGDGGRLSQRILREAAANPPSHVFFFSHGWQGDMPAAINQYNRWIKAMTDQRADAQAMGTSFKPLWIGLHWPSLPWGDDELGGNSFEAASVASNELVERYVNRLGGNPDDVRRLLRIILAENDANAGAMTLPAHVADAYQKLATVIGKTSGGPDKPPDADGVTFDAAAAFDAGNDAGDAFGALNLGGLLGPLRQLSFWKMKNRARTVGEGGMHSFIADMQQALPSTRFHLMGHSFGCIVVSSILGGPGGTTPLPRPVDSVALVQGALSLWAFAEQIPDGATPGYFNAMIKRGAVRGPIVTTQSKFDTAVGTYYPLAASLAGQVAFGGELPKFGGVGSFGIQGMGNLTPLEILPETESYKFEPGKVYNLEGSRFIKKMVGASGAHSDIDGPQVAHMIWQAALI